MSWLETAMKRRGYTYAELSKLSGVAKSEVWSIATKGRDCRLSTIRKFSEALEMPLVELLGLDDLPREVWYFEVWSQEYGKDTFGPYDSRAKAERALDKAKFHAAEVPDTVRRAYTEPYQA